MKKTSTGITVTLNFTGSDATKIRIAAKKSGASISNFARGSVLLCASEAVYRLDMLARFPGVRRNMRQFAQEATGNPADIDLL